MQSRVGSEHPRQGMFLDRILLQLKYGPPIHKAKGTPSILLEKEWKLAFRLLLPPRSCVQNTGKLSSKVRQIYEAVSRSMYAAGMLVN